MLGSILAPRLGGTMRCIGPLPTSRENLMSPKREELIPAAAALTAAKISTLPPATATSLGPTEIAKMFYEILQALVDEQPKR